MEFFFGEHPYRVDAQGRVPIPPRFRSQFPGTAVLSRGYDKYIRVSPPEEWKREAERFLRLSQTRSRNRQLLQMYFARTFEQELDRQGRVQLPSPLRQYAGIASEAVIVGMGDHLEIWDRQRWEEEQTALDANLPTLAESLEERT